MCLTLPRTLITVMGIEKLVPTWRDLEVFLQLLPRSSTGERMNPYTSMWTGRDRRARTSTSCCSTTAAPRRSPTRDGRAALRCIRCSACLNVCPVYERTGGHAYGSVYPGPIGAVLSPQLTGVRATTPRLPFASSLCGACYDVCPVAIDIPTMLVHLRAPGRRRRRGATPERAAMARCRLDDAQAAAGGRGRCARLRLGRLAARRARAAAAAVGVDAARDLPDTAAADVARLVGRDGRDAHDRP